MDSPLFAVLSGLLGGGGLVTAVAGVWKYVLKSKIGSLDDATQFRRDLLTRVRELEDQADEGRARLDLATQERITLVIQVQALKAESALIQDRLARCEQRWAAHR